MKGVIIALIVLWLISKITKVNKEPVKQSVPKEEEQTIDADFNFNTKNNAPNINDIVKNKNKVSFNSNETKNSESKTKNGKHKMTIDKDSQSFDLKRAIIYSAILERPFK